MVVFTLFAQSDFRPGYILQNNGDTLFGQIDYRGEEYNSKNCCFKADSDLQITCYLPGQIASYRFTNGKFFVTRDVDLDSKKDKVFLEFLVDGKADLYYMPGKIFLIEKEGNELIQLKNTERVIHFEDKFNLALDKDYVKEGKEYIGVLKVYMRDCPEIDNQILTSKLDQSSLIRLTTDYHNKVCPDQKCIVYSKTPPKNSIYAGVSIGCNLNTTTLYDWNDNTRHGSVTSPGILAGIHFDFMNRGMFERLFYSLNGYYSAVNKSFTYGSRLHKVPTRNFSINAIISYIYPRYRVKPFAGAGIFYFHTFDDTFNDSGFVYLTYQRTSGAIGSMGVIIELNRIIRLKIQSDYQYGFFNDNYDNRYRNEISNSNFTGTILFRLNNSAE